MKKPPFNHFTPLCANKTGSRSIVWSIFVTFLLPWQRKCDTHRRIRKWIVASGLVWLVEAVCLRMKFESRPQEQSTRLPQQIFRLFVVKTGPRLARRSRRWERTSDWLWSGAGTAPNQMHPPGHPRRRLEQTSNRWQPWTKAELGKKAGVAAVVKKQS